VPDEHCRGDVEMVDELADVGGEVVGCVAVGRGVGAGYPRTTTPVRLQVRT
jgi:hypothetical protein